MEDLLFKAAEVKKLVDFINEMPTKYGGPLIGFFNEVKNLRDKEAKAAESKKEPEPESKPVEEVVLD